MRLIHMDNRGRITFPEVPGITEPELRQLWLGGHAGDAEQIYKLGEDLFVAGQLGGYPKQVLTRAELFDHLTSMIPGFRRHPPRVPVTQPKQLIEDQSLDDILADL